MSELARKSQAVTVGVALGAAVSEPFALDEFGGLLVKVPAAAGLDAGSLVRLEVSEVKAVAGFAPVAGLTDLTPGAAAGWANPDPDGMAFPALWGRLRLVNAGGADVAQAAARSFKMMLKG